MSLDNIHTDLDNRVIIHTLLIDHLRIVINEPVFYDIHIQFSPSAFKNAYYIFIQHNRLMRGFNNNNI